MVRKLVLFGMIPLVLFAGAAMAQRGRGGWMNRVTPTTPAQQAYVAEATKLRDQILKDQQELTALQAQAKPSASVIRAKQQAITAARQKMQTLNQQNSAVRQQLGLGACTGQGPCGGDPSACPYGGPGNGACQGAGPCGGNPSACPYGGPGSGACRRMGGAGAGMMGGRGRRGR